MVGKQRKQHARKHAVYRVHAVAHAIPETPVNSRRRRRSEYALTFRHSITNARKKHPLDARLEFLPRAPNARATPKLPSRKPTRPHPPNRQCSRRKEAQHLRFSSRRARHGGPFVVRHSLHLICSTDRPGGRDCLSLFGFYQLINKFLTLFSMNHIFRLMNLEKL